MAENAAELRSWRSSGHEVGARTAVWEVGDLEGAGVGVGRRRGVDDLGGTAVGVARRRGIDGIGGKAAGVARWLGVDDLGGVAAGIAREKT